MALQGLDPAPVALAPEDSRQHLQESDQHRRITGGVLADHVEHRIDKSVIIDARHDQAQPSAAEPNSGRQVQPCDIAQCCTEPIENTDRGVGIVDAGRQRPDRHLDQLIDSEFQIDRAGPLRSQSRRLDGSRQPLHQRAAQPARSAPRETRIRPAGSVSGSRFCARPPSRRDRFGRAAANSPAGHRQPAPHLARTRRVATAAAHRSWSGAAPTRRHLC